LADCTEYRSVPGTPNDVRARTLSPRGSVSSETSVLAPSPGDSDGEPSTSNCGRLPPPEQPHNVPQNCSQPPQPYPGPVTFTGPNAPPPQQNSENGGPVPGHPNTQQIPPSQGQGPGQPSFLHFHQIGQPLNLPPPPPRYPFPPLPRSVPVFGQLHGQMGQVTGLVHQGFFNLSPRIGPGLGARQLPPGYLTAYPPPMYPQMQPRMHPHMPPHVYPQMPPQMQTQGPTPMNWGAPPGPPPPYPGPDLGPGEPTPGTNQTGPSTTQRRTSRASGTFADLRPRSLQDTNEGPKDDGTVSDVRPVPRPEATGRVPTRANPTRKARPTRLCESDQFVGS